MKIVKRMAAGIVHEIRNPVTVIKGYINLLKDSISQKHFDTIYTQINMIEQLMDGLELLAKYDHTETMELNNIEVSSFIRTCFEEINPILEAAQISIEIKCEYNHKIQCEEKLIHLLIVNLLLNAVDSMTVGGVVSIKVGEYEQDYVHIQIEDTGTGISLERLPYLGQPFFSTQEKGFGMGIMLCRTIVQKHYGSLSFYTTIDKGTNVNITLPKIQPLITKTPRILH
ncbi:ATP-binding protein [Paenibacillus sp. sgz500958]|uniref:ATP-binding protein n=1 Tax=Paenibacillus sp. sgz500958 TaxID=3242475 RepID=UPI0036D29D19